MTYAWMQELNQNQTAKAYVGAALLRELLPLLR